MTVQILRPQGYLVPGSDVLLKPTPVQTIALNQSIVAGSQDEFQYAAPQSGCISYYTPLSTAELARIHGENIPRSLLDGSQFQIRRHSLEVYEKSQKKRQDLIAEIDLLLSKYAFLAFQVLNRTDEELTGLLNLIIEFGSEIFDRIPKSKKFHMHLHGKNGAQMIGLLGARLSQKEYYGILNRVFKDEGGGEISGRWWGRVHGVFFSYLRQSQDPKIEIEKYLGDVTFKGESKWNPKHPYTKTEIVEADFFDSQLKVAHEVKFCLEKNTVLYPTKIVSWINQIRKYKKWLQQNPDMQFHLHMVRHPNMTFLEILSDEIKALDLRDRVHISFYNTQDLLNPCSISNLNNLDQSSIKKLPENLVEYASDQPDSYFLQDKAQKHSLLESLCYRRFEEYVPEKWEAQFDEIKEVLAHRSLDRDKRKIVKYLNRQRTKIQNQYGKNSIPYSDIMSLKAQFLMNQGHWLSAKRAAWEGFCSLKKALGDKLNSSAIPLLQMNIQISAKLWDVPRHDDCVELLQALI